MIESEDRILVAVSGGKDSYAMLDLLEELRATAPLRYSLIAVHIDQRQPGYDGGPLEDWLGVSGIPHEIIRRDTYSKVVEVTPDGKSYCAACSRFRRGILTEAAARLDCNKIALGHHRDDALETFFLNLLYSSKLHTMPAIYESSAGATIIRPLIECAEEDLRVHARERAYPILPCQLCGSQSGLKRQRMKALFDELEAEHPDVRQIAFRALQNIDPGRLLDPSWYESTDRSTLSGPPSVE